MFALLLRLGMIVCLPHFSIPPDTLEEYDRFATNLVQGKGYVDHYGIARVDKPAPGYPLFLACIYFFLGKSFIIVRIIQAILDSFTAVFTAVIALRVFQKTTISLCVGFLYGCNPLLIYSSNLVMTESLFTFFFIAMMLLLIIGVNSKRGIWMVFSGVLLGMAILTRPVIFLFVLVVILFLLVYPFLNSLYRRIMFVLYYIFPCVFILASWGFYNYLCCHTVEYIPGQHRSGAPFLWGSSEKYFVPDSERKQKLQIDIAHYMSSLNDGGKGISRDIDYRWTVGVNNYKKLYYSDRKGFILFILKKIGRLWYGTDSRKYEKQIAMIMIPLVLLGLCGFVISFRRFEKRGDILLISSGIGYFSFMHILFFPIVRFMIPIIPLVLLFVGVSIVAGWEYIRFCIKGSTYEKK